MRLGAIFMVPYFADLLSALVLILAARNWKIRQLVGQTLLTGVVFVCPIVVRYLSEHPDAEVRVRSEMAMRESYRLWTQLWLQLQMPLPFIDLQGPDDKWYMPAEHYIYRDIALTNVTAYEHKGEWSEYREATGLWLECELLDGCKSFGDVKRLIERMKAHPLNGQ